MHNEAEGQLSADPGKTAGFLWQSSMICSARSPRDLAAVPCAALLFGKLLLNKARDGKSEDVTLFCFKRLIFPMRYFWEGANESVI